MRLIYYSLVYLNNDRYVEQWVQSISSLRRYNSRITVYLVLFNGLPARIADAAKRWNVTIAFVGEYTEYLYRLHVQGPVLALLPPVPKLISLHHTPVQEASQVLYLDCDTFFFDDVEILFDRYSACHWYGREEPTSRQSYHEYDPLHVNEELLQELAESEGARPVPPFNTGVCLLNHGIWHLLDRLRITFLDTVWRLAVGWRVALQDPSDADPQVQHAVFAALTEFDRSRALRYPSSKLWIIDQVALWLTLGRLPYASPGLFAQAHVAQNGEFQRALRNPGGLVVAHYFSAHESSFFSDLDKYR